MHGDAVDEPSAPTSHSSTVLQTMRKQMQIISPILQAFYDQLKEPLILMLLFSAAISLFLGNAADAISIALALSIVSLVAAVQEYRSEKGELPMKTKIATLCVISFLHMIFCLVLFVM